MFTNDSESRVPVSSFVIWRTLCHGAGPAGDIVTAVTAMARLVVQVGWNLNCEGTTRRRGSAVPQASDEPLCHSGSNQKPSSDLTL
jgi:hypothetical protein